ncbi:hypothetical protein BDV25DRAFT_33718 [Aspergillus avenaceus]|uniref:Apple domain-containing protein n=1 Tax=Aspergillus avenaceus TaxID=36643 RepID=A0A5N6TM39_ASPAV|nr:hypothetical protein BDV25DRAFT_33718 [Aspergillus avenaceus]
MLFLSFYVALELASLSLGQNTGSCLSGTSGQGSANYQACCPTPEAVGTEPLDSGQFRYTCGHWMSEYDDTSHTAHSAGECARHCLLNDDCRASTWISSTFQCLLTLTEGVQIQTSQYGTGFLALQKVSGMNLDDLCESRVEDANSACDVRVGEAEETGRNNVAAANSACDVRVGAAEETGRNNVAAANSACDARVRAAEEAGRNNVAAANNACNARVSAAEEAGRNNVANIKAAWDRDARASLRMTNECIGKLNRCYANGGRR